MNLRRRFAALGLLLVAAAPLLAEQRPIAHERLECLSARKNCVVFATCEAPGEARLYYRRVGASEWCYVEGTRILNRVRAILPEFEPDVDIEHFFVMLHEGEVTARSAKIHSVKVRNHCETLVARGTEFLLNTCEGEAGQLGSAIAAGYALERVDCLEPASLASPEDPCVPAD